MTPAAYRVLQKLESGAPLYHGAGRVFFSTADRVRPALVTALFQHGWIEEGTRFPMGETYRITPAGSEALNQAPEPAPTYEPLLIPAFFAGIRDRLNPDTDISRIDSVVGCVIWTGKIRDGKYPVVVVDGAEYTLHRLLYEHYFGRVDKSSRLKNDTCHRYNCVNPYHWVDKNNLREKEDILAQIKRAVLAQDDEWLETILAEIKPPEPDPVAPPGPFQRRTTQAELEDLIEETWEQYQPRTVEELYQYLPFIEGDPESFTLMEVRLALQSNSMKRIRGWLDDV